MDEVILETARFACGGRSSSLSGNIVAEGDTYFFFSVVSETEPGRNVYTLHPDSAHREEGVGDNVFVRSWEK